MSDAVYYRIKVESSGDLRVCCLQDFDEVDYNERQWLTAKNFPWLAKLVDLKDKYYTEDAALEVVSWVALHNCRTYLRTIVRACA